MIMVSCLYIICVLGSLLGSSTVMGSSCKCIPVSYGCQNRGTIINFSFGRPPPVCLPELIYCCDEDALERSDDGQDSSSNDVKRDLDFLSPLSHMIETDFQDKDLEQNTFVEDFMDSKIDIDYETSLDSQKPPIVDQVHLNIDAETTRSSKLQRDVSTSLPEIDNNPLMTKESGGTFEQSYPYSTTDNSTEDGTSIAEDTTDVTASTLDATKFASTNTISLLDDTSFMAQEPSKVTTEDGTSIAEDTNDVTASTLDATKFASTNTISWVDTTSFMAQEPSEMTSTLETTGFPYSISTHNVYLDRFTSVTTDAYTDDFTSSPTTDVYTDDFTSSMMTDVHPDYSTSFATTAVYPDFTSSITTEADPDYLTSYMTTDVQLENYTSSTTTDIQPDGFTSSNVYFEDFTSSITAGTQPDFTSPMRKDFVSLVTADEYLSTITNDVYEFTTTNDTDFDTTVNNDNSTSAKNTHLNLFSGTALSTTTETELVVMSDDMMYDMLLATTDLSSNMTEPVELDSNASVSDILAADMVYDSTMKFTDETTYTPTTIVYNDSNVNFTDGTLDMITTVNFDHDFDEVYYTSTNLDTSQSTTVTSTTVDVTEETSTQLSYIGTVASFDDLNLTDHIFDDVTTEKPKTNLQNSESLTNPIQIDAHTQSNTEYTHFSQPATTGLDSTTEVDITFSKNETSRQGDSSFTVSENDTARPDISESSLSSDITFGTSSTLSVNELSSSETNQSDVTTSELVNSEVLNETQIHDTETSTSFHRENMDNANLPNFTTTNYESGMINTTVSTGEETSFVTRNPVTLKPIHIGGDPNFVPDFRDDETSTSTMKPGNDKFDFFKWFFGFL